MPDVDGFSDFGKAVAATGGAPGTHWLGDLEPSKLWARFEVESVQVFENGPSGQVPKLENGIPVYKDELHIRIFVPGGDITARKARESDKVEYKAAWDAFERGNVDEISGTPLKEWPVATPAVISTLNAANVFNVEGLAALSDAHCEKIGNLAFIYRDKALEWLEKAQGNDAKVEALETQNAALAEQLAAMQEQINKMTAPKRRGRPPKKKVQADVPVVNDSGNSGPAEPEST